jgi:hypothetical protein
LDISDQVQRRPLAAFFIRCTVKETLQKSGLLRVSKVLKFISFVRSREVYPAGGEQHLSASASIPFSRT